MIYMNEIIYIGYVNGSVHNVKYKKGGVALDLDYKAIGKRIKIARVNKGYTQEKVANLTDSAPSHISNIETAKSKVGLATLVEICNVLDVSVDEVLSDNVVSYRNQFTNKMIQLCQVCTDEQKRFVIILVEAALSFFEKDRRNQEA